MFNSETSKVVRGLSLLGIITQHKGKVVLKAGKITPIKSSQRWKMLKRLTLSQHLFQNPENSPPSLQNSEQVKGT